MKQRKSRSKYRMVSGIVKGSIAEEAGIEPGDIIESIDGKCIGDVFDYRLLTSAGNFTARIIRANGEILDLEIEKDEYEDPGLLFEDPMMDSMRTCNNKCIFCFIDQLPSGMRKTLHIKDDDPRLSFTEGNYVTLTNTGSDEIDRLIRYRMSPLNVSVHAAEIDLRRKMLGNPEAGDILHDIEKLVEGGITVNCQIVLCRGINDGSHLNDTVEKLSRYYPGMASISVVPAGLTDHRQGLAEIIPYDASSARAVLGQLKPLQDRYIEEKKSRIVYAADEFYVLSGSRLPEELEYEGYPQIENGVGLLTSFIKELHEYLHEKGYIRYNKDKKLSGMFGIKTHKADSVAPGRGTVPVIKSVVTGEAAFPYIADMAKLLEKVSREPLKINVYPIKNNFFGRNINVTGLITGRDLISQLKGKKLGAKLCVSSCILRDGCGRFLDDLTVCQAEEALDIVIDVIDNNGRSFAEALLAGGKSIV
ncbi:MAG: DUF512 domain-containing protein [Eubacteriales bacterium]|nr:DUF512 domain-containing protein [Eubacteriales bacterium]